MMILSNLKSSFFSIILFLSFFFGVAQDKIPSAPQKVRKLPVDFKKPYQGEDYNYEDKVSILDKIIQYINYILSKIFNSTFKDENSNDTNFAIRFFYILLIITVIYFLTKLIRNKEARWLFAKNKETQEDIDVEEIQNINEADFKSLITQAENDLDYRSAIKYYYLLVLKRMDKTEAISYDSQKTTHDYSLSLKGSKHHTNFSKIAYYYTYIWYGEFEINSEEYKTASSVFVELLKQFDNE